jgi:hypothetical protein
VNKRRPDDDFTAFGDIAGRIAKDHSLRQAHAQPHRPGLGRGLLVNYQSIELFVWIGIATLAFICANLSLWHARRVLSQPGQVPEMQDTTYLAAAQGERTSPVLAP